MKLILTCEHGGNGIPNKYKHLFNNVDALASHRGYDLGALDLCDFLRPLASNYFFSKTSRLLIELNRSLHHQLLFSEFTKHLPSQEKIKIIEQHYLPYRNQVEKTIDEYISKNEVVFHLSVHSFTPYWKGTYRNCDIGLLYDSRLKEERKICDYFKNSLLNELPKANIRFNYPYLGKADGFTSYLRKQFPKHYLGIEIEVNQNFSSNNCFDKNLKQAIYKSLKTMHS